MLAGFCRIKEKPALENASKSAQKKSASANEGVTAEFFIEISMKDPSWNKYIVCFLESAIKGAVDSLHTRARSLPSSDSVPQSHL